MVRSRRASASIRGLDAMPSTAGSDGEKRCVWMYRLHSPRSTQAPSTCASRCQMRNSGGMIWFVAQEHHDAPLRQLGRVVQGGGPSARHVDAPLGQVHASAGDMETQDLLRRIHRGIIDDDDLPVATGQQLVLERGEREVQVGGPIARGHDHRGREPREGRADLLDGRPQGDGCKSAARDTEARVSAVEEHWSWSAFDPHGYLQCFDIGTQASG